MNFLVMEKINRDEYPPKYVGVKGSGKEKMVYRIDGEKGLVFRMNRHTGESEYRWEHFKTIRKALIKN